MSTSVATNSSFRGVAWRGVAWRGDDEGDDTLPNWDPRQNSAQDGRVRGHDEAFGRPRGSGMAVWRRNGPVRLGTTLFGRGGFRGRGMAPSAMRMAGDGWFGPPMGGASIVVASWPGA